MRILAALLAILASAYAADWLSFGGDPQGTNWQRHGKALTVENVKDLKLLWKRRLGDQSLSAPVIIGPTITHRGVRELVFVAGAGDNLYAIDADLGTLFWKRHFDVKSQSTCAAFTTPTPVLEPDPDEDFSDPAADDEDDDEAAPMRPLYAVSSDGRLHTIRVSDGNDITSPRDFLPPNASYSNLNFWSGTIYATVWDGCNKATAGLWSLDVKKPNASPKFDSSKGGRRVVIGTTGTVHTEALDSRLLPNTRNNGTATWRDSNGVRWIYAAATRNVMAFKVTGPANGPKLEPAWTFDAINAGPPVVTNGLIFLLTGPGVADWGSTTLTALDAATGKQLYSSESITYAYAPHLAIANGHICFAGLETLYCYGIPLER